MRVWIDMTNSPHVPLLPAADPTARGGRPRGRGDVARLRPDAAAAGAARDRSRRRRAGARRAAPRSARRGRSQRGCRRCADSRRGRSFDLALAHGSHELTLAARSLGIPSATAHDYEFASLQHQLGLRAARRVVFPDADAPGAPGAVRRPDTEARTLSGDQGGVLPRRLRAGSGGRCRHRPRESASRGSPSPRGIALPPGRYESATRPAADANRPGRVASCRRAASNRDAARVCQGRAAGRLEIPCP